jgi:hypothetical protein
MEEIYKVLVHQLLGLVHNLEMEAWIRILILIRIIFIQLKEMILKHLNCKIYFIFILFIGLVEIILD